MLLVDWMMALWLLTSSPDTGLPDQTWYPVLQLPMQTWAVKLELLDRREVRYVLASHKDFLHDLQLLRRRWAELHDAPYVTDSLRFPDRKTINGWLAFNRAFQQRLQALLHLGLLSNAERRALKETDRMYQVWDCVRDARCEYYYVTVRRQALLHLKKKLGNACFDAGQVPPPFPLWRLDLLSRPVTMRPW